MTNALQVISQVQNCQPKIKQKMENLIRNKLHVNNNKILYKLKMNFLKVITILQMPEKNYLCDKDRSPKMSNKWEKEQK